MKKKNGLVITIFVTIIVLPTITLLTIYSKEKFHTYNFFKSFYSINILSEKNKVIKIDHNVYLLHPTYKQNYINKYLTNWEAIRYDEAGWFKFCNENYCFNLKVYTNKFFNKNYLIIKEGEIYEKK